MAGQGTHTPSLPQELLLMIMVQVSHGELFSASRRSLKAAMLVNRAWYEAASGVTWRISHAPALASVSKDRRQHYANKIVELYFEGEEQGKLHATFKDLQFPLLKIAFLNRVRLNKRQKLWVGQYIQPRLESFNCYIEHPCKGLFDDLTSKCPLLSELHLEHPIDWSGSERVVRFVQSCKSLKSITFGRGWIDKIDTNVFAALAAHENLERLEAGSLVLSAIVSESLQLVSSPFQNLYSLHIRTESSSMKHLSAATKTLRVLFLRVEDDEEDILVALSLMTELIQLEITYMSMNHLTREGIGALSNLKKLQVLLLEPTVEPLTAWWMNDDEFIDLMSNFKRLKSLDFKVDTDVTLRSYTSLSTSHKRLDNMCLYGEYDLDDWATMTTPVFPHLTRLGMDAPALTGRTRRDSASILSKAARIVDIIEHHVPNLEQLCFHAFKQNRLATLVLEQYGARIGGHFIASLATTFKPWDFVQEIQGLAVDKSRETRIVHDD